MHVPRKANDGLSDGPAFHTHTHTSVSQNEEKEAALRKAAKEVATLRADCARLGQAAERWQGQHELLAAAADHAARGAVQQCEEQLAAAETAHRAQVAT